MHPVEYNKDNWRADARCKGSDPEIFFVERGGDNKIAKAICEECIVVVPCLDYALQAKEPGVYGGTTERERKYIKRAGFSALQYIQGRNDGTITRPKRGRPIRT